MHRVQIQAKKQLRPRVCSPGVLPIFLLNSRYGIELASTLSKIKIGVPAIIGRASLQAVAQTGGERHYPSRRETAELQTQPEMDVNTQPNNMIDNRIENASGPALLIRQASKLSICVIKNVRDDVKKHSDQIDGKGLIKIKMTGDDAEDSADDSDGRWCEIQSRKKLRQRKANTSIKRKIDNPLDLARFVSRIDRRWRRRSWFQDCAEIASHFRRSATLRERACLEE